MPEDFGGFEFIEARRARGPMKKRLMRAEGGSCYLKVGNVTRLLSHNPTLDAPLTRLPWPLSKMQPHEIRNEEMIGETRTAEQRFQGSQVDVAIEHFLRGVDPSEEVQLQP
jgi:hypothetical protein